ncbi:MAG: heparinase II/III domain-containing protein [Armatimonadota bacterium]
MDEWNHNAGSEVSHSVQVSDVGVSVTQLGRAINSSQRPFVLISERELSVLRRGLTKDGWKRALYLQPADLRHGIYVGAGLLSVANQWLEKDVHIPERGGVEDHFVCECGAGLEVPGDFEIREQYVCPACSRKCSGEAYDGALRHMQHKRLAGAALALALAYNIERDRAYSDKAAAVLLAYAEAYPSLIPRADSGGMIVCNSSDEAACAIALAQAYDLTYYSRSLNEEARSVVETQLMKPLAEGFRDLGGKGLSGAWHLSAVGVIGMTLKDAHFVAYALENYAEWTSRELVDGGLYPKSVHRLHFSAVSAFLHLAEAFYRGGIDIFSLGSGGPASLRAMFAAPLSLMYPSFRLPAIGDGPFDSFVPLDLYEVAYRRWGDAEFAWALKKGYSFGGVPANLYHRQHPELFTRSGFYAFLFGRDLPGRSISPIFKNANYPTLGMCCLRSDKSLMATVSYASNPAHNHLGKLGFTLCADEQVVVPDFGSPALGQDAVEWFRSSISHNSVVVDGKSQSPSTNNASVTLYTGTFLQGVECRADDCYPGVSHTRTVTMLDGVCAIHDVLASDDEHVYDWLMRCEGIPEVRGDYEPCEVEPSGMPALDWEKAYRVDESCRVDWKLANGELALTMWHLDGGGAFAVGNCASDTISRRVPILRCRQHGKEVCFLAVLVPSRVCDDVILEKDGSVITLTTQDNIDYLFMRGCGMGEDSVLETDADFAAVRTSRGAVKSVILSNGSWLKWNGVSMLECSLGVGCLEVVFEERGPQVKYRGCETGFVKVKTSARAMRVNGHRAAASNSKGYATLRVAEHMVESDSALNKN